MIIIIMMTFMITVIKEETRMIFIVIRILIMIYMRIPYSFYGNMNGYNIKHCNLR